MNIVDITFLCFFCHYWISVQ